MAAALGAREERVAVLAVVAAAATAAATAAARHQTLGWARLPKGGEVRCGVHAALATARLERLATARLVRLTTPPLERLTTAQLPPCLREPLTTALRPWMG